MKALVTGSGGFVGHYMRKELEEHGYEVVGLDIVEAPQTICANLLDAEQVCAVIGQEKPDVIVHLAGQANVGASWKIPQKTFEINVFGAVNIMEAVRACWILILFWLDLRMNMETLGQWESQFQRTL